MDDKVLLGSETAKWWFRNEEFVVACFNDWENNKMAQEWLVSMWYNIPEIDYVHASKIKGSYKADVQVEIRVEIKLKELVDIQNLQVKLVSNPQGFNQIDKRWIRNYKELWNIPSDVEKLLKHFTWELPPYISNPRDARRMFADEFSEEERSILLNFFEDNKTLIITDILKWRWKFSAEWMLVILNIEWEEMKRALKPMNYILNIFGNWPVSTTERWSFKIGKITIQRKWWDWWRETANMLQFKINPCEIFNTDES